MIPVNPLSSHFRNNRIPKYHTCHFINEEYSSRHAMLPHIHDGFLELYYVFSGKGRYMVDNRFYDIKEGDIVICNAGILHGEDPEDTRHIRSYSIGISNVALSDLPENWVCDEKASPVISCGMLSKQVGNLFRLVYLLSSDPKNLRTACTYISISLLLLTYEMLLNRDHIITPHTYTSASATANRIRRYLDTHYHEPLTLAVVGKALHISEYYLSHVFKNEFGVPPMQYVMKRRIGEAQNLLMDTSASIGEIADHLAFSSICHFNTMFNKYVGIPPGKYRRSFRNMKE